MQKPARYIGCEDGAVTPRARAAQGRLAADLPRHLRGRPAQPGPPDPLRDPQRARRRRRRAGLLPVDRPRRRAAPAPGAAVQRRHATARPPTSTSSPSTCRPSSSTRTSSSASTSPASRCTPTAAPTTTPLVVAGGHCAFNPEPLADFVDVAVLGDGEEVVGEITEVHRRRGSGPASPRAAASACCATSPRSRASTCRASTSAPTTAPGLVAVTPRYADVPAAGREAHHRRPGRLAVPEAPARAAHRGRARPAQRRGVPRLHPWLPLLPGRHDHPAGAGAAGRPGAHDGARRPRAAPATTRWRSPRCPPPTSPASTRWSATSGSGPATAALVRARGAGVGEPAEPAGRRLHRRHRRQAPAGPAQRPHLRPRGRHLADAPGDQQAHHRGRPLRRGRVGLLAGLAAGEALLPHRAAHRDRRGHPRHRRAGPQRASSIGRQPHQGRVGHGLGRWVRAQAADAVPVVRPEHRGRAPAQGRPPARRPQAEPAACS